MDESYFFKLKSVAKDRLSPNGEVAFFLGILLYSGALLGICFFAIYYAVDFKKTSELFKGLFIGSGVMIILLIILFCLCVLFEKMVFKIQKILGVVTVLYTIFIAYFPFFIFYLSSIDRKWVHQFVEWLIIFLIGSFLFFIFITINTLNNVRNKELSKKGRGLFVWNLMLKLILVYTLVFLASVILLYIYFNDGIVNLGTITIFCFLNLCFLTGVQEFILIAYCRIKFPSFTVTYEEATKYRINKKKQKRRKKK